MEHLNLEKYRKRLIEERNRLLEAIEDVSEDISYDDTGAGQSELAHYDNHPADSGTETFDKELDVSVRENWRGLIGRIDEALGKIERGTYGECDRCGRAISKQRLDAVPYAIYCVECQDTIEGR